VRKDVISVSERAIMQNPHIDGHHVVETCERAAGHVVAMVVGFVLMIVGIAMGVTIVLLPMGIPVGLAGFFLFLWGLFVAGPAKRAQQVGANRPNG
jgi:hypothetical protein